MTKPLYFYNGTTFEQVGPTTPQSPIAYQTSAPTGPATGDLWIDSDGDVDTYNRQLTRYYFVATAAQTTITGTDANGLTLAYVAGSEAVYVNGALQVRGQDYTATNGTTVVLTAALAVNDVVEIFAYTAFTVANAYTKTETDGIAAAAAGLRMVVPTSVAVGSGTGSVDAIGNVTFSGASSVSVNGCFTTTYDNYRIIFNTALSADADLTFKYRNSGTDTSAAYYSYNHSMFPIAGTQGAGTRTNNSTFIAFNGGLGTLNYVVDIRNPYISGQKKYLNAQGISSALYSIHQTGGSLDNTNQFDSFTLAPQSGNITGTIRVYGYKD